MNLLGENMGKKIYIHLGLYWSWIFYLLIRGKPKKVGAPSYESLSQEFSVTKCSSVMKMITIKRPLRSSDITSEVRENIASN